MVMVYPIDLISRGCSSRHFKPQKKHKSRMDTRLSSLRPSSDAVLHMSRIECKWAKSFVLSHLHSIRLMWSTASEPGLSHQYEQLQCTLDYYKHSIITRTLFTIGLPLRSGKSPTRNYSIYFAVFIQVIPMKSYMSNFYVTVLFNVVKWRLN